MKRLLTLLFILSAVYCTAQNDIMVTDCPSASTPPSICRLHTPQIEASIAGTTPAGLLNFNTLLRYGVNENAEFRIQTDYLTTISIGTKLALLKGNLMIPQTSLLFNFNLPILQSKTVVPFLVFLFQNNITKRLSIVYNIGLEDYGTGLEPTLFTSESFWYCASKTITLFIENYNYNGIDIGTNSSQNCYDLGFACMITRNFQVNVAGGIGNGNTVTLGAAWMPIKHYNSKKMPGRAD